MLYKKNFIRAIFVLLFSISFIFAAHVITTSGGGTSYNVDEDVGFIYNITVNNTDTTAPANISAVNITIPDSFSFLVNSNGTNAGTHTFTNTSTVLSWQNDGLVMNLTSNYFWLNATASTPGSYNLTITTLNTTGTSSSNISVTINDTTSPSSIEFVSPTESDNSNLSQSNIAINVTAADNGAIDTIIARLFNSTNDQINSSTSATSPLFINFTGLSDGVYYFNATVNDTYGNSNSTSTRTITLDATNPLISYGTLTSADNANLSQTSIYVNVSVTETNEANITFLLYNSTGQVNSTTYTDGTRTINWTGLGDETYTYNVTLIDDASNSNTTSTRTITLDTTTPVITLLSPSDAISATTSAYNFTFNISESNDILNCSLIVDDSVIHTLTNLNTTGGVNGMYNSSFSIATHTWSVNCTDIAGNVGNSSSRTFIVTAATTSSGGSSGYPPSKPTLAQLNEGYEKIMYKNWKVQFKVDNDIHTFKVEEITDTSVDISIASELQKDTLKVGEEKKFELSGDDYYDLSIKINSIKSSFRVNKANITIKKIHEIKEDFQTINNDAEDAKEEISEEASPSITGNMIVDDGKKDLSLISISIGILMVIALVVVIFVGFRHRKKSKK